eukprot:s4229_g4.t1
MNLMLVGEKVTVKVPEHSVDELTGAPLFGGEKVTVKVPEHSVDELTGAPLNHEQELIAVALLLQTILEGIELDELGIRILEPSLL